MSYRRPARQELPYPLRQVRYLLSRLFGTRLQKAKSLHFVTMNGQRFKRLVLCDSFLASEIERNLECFAESPHFPRLVTRYEREIWVEFVDGPRITSPDEKLAEQLADFYAAIYKRRPIQVDTVASPFPQRLAQDLRFLNQVGVLADSVYRDLRAAVEQLIPKRVWMGFDYSDPVLKNFVIVQDDDCLCAVDVEGLAENQLIGMGLVKALIRWLEPYREVFFDRTARQEVPDFHAYFPFVELCFLSKWTKRSFFEKKWKAVNPVLFERFLSANSLQHPCEQMHQATRGHEPVDDDDKRTF